MASVIDVAKCVLETYGSTTTMKLQKLTYYCQAVALGTYGYAMFEEDFQAWTNGPVSPALFDQHRGMYIIEANDLPDANADALSAKDKEIVRRVCDQLGSASGAELSKRTHAEDPWRNVRGNLPVFARSGELISKESMRDYYSRYPVLS